LVWFLRHSENGVSFELIRFGVACVQAPVRNHPLMLLSGVGTNAVGFDLSPGVSLVFLLLLASNRIKHVNQKIKKMTVVTNLNCDLHVLFR